jgi:hypothetical protein
MHDIANHPPNRNIRPSLARIRRQAKRRGFRVLRDWAGGYSLVDAKIEPQRALLGLDHAPLWTIEQTLFTPLPEPPPRRKRAARPGVEETLRNSEQTAETSREPHAQAHHSFLALVEALKAQGGES